jgi:hypothetical protein
MYIGYWASWNNLRIPVLWSSQCTSNLQTPVALNCVVGVSVSDFKKLAVKHIVRSLHVLAVEFILSSGVPLHMLQWNESEVIGCAGAGIHPLLIVGFLYDSSQYRSQSNLTAHVLRCTVLHGRELGLLAQQYWISEYQSVSKLNKHFFLSMVVIVITWLVTIRIMPKIICILKLF